MENNPTDAVSFMCAIISLMCCMFASILNNLELVTRIAVGAIGVASGVMATRYYIYATIEKKESIKKLKSDK